MSSGILSAARRWVMALGLAAATTLPTVTGAALAAPIVALPEAAVPASESNVIAVRDRYQGDRGWARHYEYRDADRGWDRHRFYRQRHYRDHNSGLALGLGIGLPLAAYLATRPAYYDEPYGYYDDRYVVRRVAPRPVYRTYGGNNHVSWCYNRYRSYRAYDNSFQPYHGPRQQCYSPYS